MFQNKLYTADRLPCSDCQMLKMYFLWDVICVEIYCYIGNDSREFLHSDSALAKGFNGDIAHKTKTELNVNLRLFYDEAWIKDEETTVEEHCWDLWMV